MNNHPSAVVVGVGALRGIGGAVCLAAAEHGLHVIVVGRTQTKIDAVVDAIEGRGGRATAMVADATDGQALGAAVEVACATGPLELAVYNAGNMVSGNFLELSPDTFRSCWEVSCFGAFLFSQQVLRRMLEQGKGSVLFTGATASLKGNPNFAPFTSAKGALRNLTQSLAREFAPKGIHVAHMVIDGGVAGDLLESRFADYMKEQGLERFVGLEGIAQAYLAVHDQPRNAWTHELELRTHLAQW